jgi:hypothetical protein
MVLVAKGGDGEIDLWREFLPQLRLRGFDGPARLAVFLSQFGRLFFPIIGDAPFADRDLLLLRIALLRRGKRSSISKNPGIRSAMSTLHHDMAQ